MTESIPAASTTLRVLIVEDDTLVGMGLRSHLEKLGHCAVGQAANAQQAMDLFRIHKPDLVLLDIRLDGDDGIELASRLAAHRRCPMLIVSAYSDSELIHRASAAGVFGYLIKPVSIPSLAAQIEVAVQRFREHQQLTHEKETLAHTLETRKLVDRAKGILMKHLKLEEPDAHRHLQLESQKHRITLAEVARKIINSKMLFSEP